MGPADAVAATHRRQDADVCIPWAASRKDRLDRGPRDVCGQVRRL